MTKSEIVAKFKRERIAKLEAMDIAEVAKMALARPGEDVLMIDEAAFTKLVEGAACKEHPQLPRDRAFSKVFGEDSERGTLIRKAWSAIKAAVPLFEVTILESPEDQHRAVNDTESSEALLQLQALAEKLRAEATGGKLSKEQAFSRVFSDPANRELAAKAHKRPEPTTQYPFPR
jgi:hypothetical protein